MVPVSTAEAREQILTDLAAATDQLALAAACLGEAYERLDDATADRLEDELYRPVQKAFGRAKRTHVQFAERVGFAKQSFELPPPPGGVKGAKPLIEAAMENAADADHLIAELQDSMLPIEAGDAELRTGLIETRELLDGAALLGREIVRRLGR